MAKRNIALIQLDNGDLDRVKFTRWPIESFDHNGKKHTIDPKAIRHRKGKNYVFFDDNRIEPLTILYDQKESDKAKTMHGLDQSKIVRDFVNEPEPVNKWMLVFVLMFGVMVGLFAMVIAYPHIFG